MASHNRIEYKPGEIVGKCEFVEDRANWHDNRMGLFKCLEEGCGKEFITLIQCVRQGHTKSCGCLGPKKLSEATIKRNTTHGMSKTYFYSRWLGIRSRCFNEKNPVYYRYGGVGITVYEPWKKDFLSFYNHIKTLDGFREDIMGYELTLDRIDVYGNYEPGNLRWADTHIQAVNKKPRYAKGANYTGVYLRDDKFRSHLMVNRKRHYFGTFDTQEQAAMERGMFIIKSGLWEYPLQVIRKTT